MLKVLGQLQTGCPVGPSPPSPQRQSFGVSPHLIAPGVPADPSTFRIHNHNTVQTGQEAAVADPLSQTVTETRHNNYNHPSQSDAELEPPSPKKGGDVVNDDLHPSPLLLPQQQALGPASEKSSIEEGRDVEDRLGLKRMPNEGGGFNREYLPKRNSSSYRIRSSVDGMRRSAGQRKGTIIGIYGDTNSDHNNINHYHQHNNYHNAQRQAEQVDGGVKGRGLLSSTSGGREIVRERERVGEGGDHRKISQSEPNSPNRDSKRISWPHPNQREAEQRLREWREKLRQDEARQRQLLGGEKVKLGQERENENEKGGKEREREREKEKERGEEPIEGGGGEDGGSSGGGGYFGEEDFFQTVLPPSSMIDDETTDFLLRRRFMSLSQMRRHQLLMSEINAMSQVDSISEDEDVEYEREEEVRHFARVRRLGWEEESMLREEGKQGTILEKRETEKEIEKGKDKEREKESEIIEKEKEQEGRDTNLGLSLSSSFDSDSTIQWFVSEEVVRNPFGQKKKRMTANNNRKSSQKFWRKKEGKSWKRQKRERKKKNKGDSSYVPHIFNESKRQWKKEKKQRKEGEGEVEGGKEEKEKKEEKEEGKSHGGDIGSNQHSEEDEEEDDGEESDEFTDDEHEGERSRRLKRIHSYRPYEQWDELTQVHVEDEFIPLV